MSFAEIAACSNLTPAGKCLIETYGLKLWQIAEIAYHNDSYFPNYIVNRALDLVLSCNTWDEYTEKYFDVVGMYR